MSVTTVPLLPTALATVEDVSGYMKIAIPSPGDTLELLNRHINSATRRVEKFCRRPFLVRTLNEIHNGDGERRLFLRARPMVDLVQVDELDEEGESVSTFLSTDLIVDLAHGIIQRKRTGRFTRGLQKWQVEYNASYPTLQDIPDEVALATMLLVARSWRDMDQQRDDINIQNLQDGQSVIYNQDILPPRVVGLLRPYQHAYMEGNI